MRRTAVLSLLLALPLLLAGCRAGGRSEPEQIYPVSAVGFDPDSNGGVRLSLEVPLTRESADESPAPALFTGEGGTVEEALRQIAAGLGRRLLFSHCALLVLGDGLSREQMEAIFGFAESGVTLPLAAQVIAAPDAGALLRGGSLSTPAAGYDVPGIFRQVSGSLGLDVRCRIYELRADASPGRPVVLPLFRAAGEDAPEAAVFGGLRLLREGKPALELSPEQSVWYAMLTDRYDGENGSPGGLLGVRLRGVKSEIGAGRSGEDLWLSLALRMEAADRLPAGEADALCTRIEEGVRGLFLSLREQAGEDVFLLGDRLARQDAALWQELAPDFARLFAGAELRVSCEIRAKESGNR